MAKEVLEDMVQRLERTILREERWKREGDMV